MSTTKIVKVGSVRVEDTAEGRAFVGSDWQTGEAVTLFLIEARHWAGYPVGALPRYKDEGQVLQQADAVAYNPEAAGPPNQIGYTTSPVDYDFGCTVELETFACQVYPGERERTYRRVLILGGASMSGFSTSQSRRYENWTTEDPRLVRDRFAAEIAATAAQIAAEAERIASDEAKLRVMTADELRAELAQRVKIFDSDCITDRITGADVRRCSAALTAAEALIAARDWAEVSAKIVTGRPILVPAVPPEENTDPWIVKHCGRWIPGKAAYLIEVRDLPTHFAPGLPVDERSVSYWLDNGGYSSMPARELADLCRAPGAVQDEGRWPALEQRKKLVKRLGKSLLETFEYRAADGARYWVAQPRYTSDWIVLDDDAKICRKRAVAAAAISAASDAMAKRFYSTC